MMSNQHKPFNVKSELFTEYTEKNRNLLDIIKKERRKLINEKNVKKTVKNVKNNSNEKDKIRGSFKGNNLNSLSKSVKVISKSKAKADYGERINNFSPRNKLGIKTGVY